MVNWNSEETDERKSGDVARDREKTRRAVELNCAERG